MSGDRLKFYKGIITLLAVAGVVISGYFIVQSIGWGSLAVFSVKSFLLGSAIGAVAIAKKKIAVEKRVGNRIVQEYVEIDDPSGKWFIFGFGIIATVGSFFLVGGLLALTTLFVFFSGFMFVYSGAADELMGAREFVSLLGFAVVIAALFWASSAFFTWAWPYILRFLA